MLNSKIIISVIIFIGCIANYGLSSPQWGGKPKYDVQFEYLEITNYSTDYFRDVNARVKKFNRTIYVISGTFELVTALDDDFSATYYINAEQGNEYRLVGAPITHEKLCTKLGEDTIAYPDILKVSNFVKLPDNCPVQPDKFWVKDYVSDSDKWPSIPKISEKWRADMIIKHKGKFAGMGSLYMLIKFL